MEEKQVEIRPQLIPFLFKEFEGTEMGYMDRKVKSVRFVSRSSITKYLYNQIDYKKKPDRDGQDKFYLFLSIEQKKPCVYSGLVYKDIGGVKEPLMMSEEKIRSFNDLLEDIFRISFVNFVDGYTVGIPNLSEAIGRFIDLYDLLEVGMSKESLRLLYYREKETPLLTRLQTQSSNRVQNYK